MSESFSQKYRVGIVGATGMVGQRFISLLENHPWFEVTMVAASARSSGKTYREAVEGRWAFDWPIPEHVAEMCVHDASDVSAWVDLVDFVFCAVDMKKDEIRSLEELIAKHEVPVVSNNSACRGIPDVPMMIPEINSDHVAVIETQKKRLGTKCGFIAVKPNCSIQSYVPALTPLLDFEPEKVSVCTYQAISGAGKTFRTWPEMVDNVIPYIGGEDEKSEQEPLKIWGHLEDSPEGSIIVNAKLPVISAQCLRVACSDGHMAAVSVSFRSKPSYEEILNRWKNFETLPQKLNLPSAPRPFLQYFEDPSRPQTRLDRDFERGYGVSIGRLREDRIFDWRFVCLSHNIIRGAAGGGILSAEMLCAKGLIPHRI
ncbi:MAG: aspartate-semialdehyde dehydrogenase [Clostridia bacterium]|nr:aspartate-semialdehyde dehydrogenase [Clostridia bacterium]